VGDGDTHLVFTEQAAFVGGHESPARRAEGMGGLLDALGEELQSENPGRLSGTPPGRGHRSHRLRGTSEQRDARPSQSAHFRASGHLGSGTNDSRSGRPTEGHLAGPVAFGA
jgi:hypothetical protein